jgi:hypothetical protein
MSTAVQTGSGGPAAVTAPPITGVDRFTLAIAAGAVALVLVGIATAVLVGHGEPAPDLATPTGVTLAYELALERGEGDAAWDLLAAPARAGITRQEFLARAAGLGGRGPGARLAVENVRVAGAVAHLDLVRTTPTGGLLGLGAGTYTTRHPVTLELEEGAWRVSVPAEPWLIMRGPGSVAP